MIDNIQKLYEIAGVNKRPQGYCDFQYGASCPYDDQNCDTTCPYWVDEEPAYPPFTAEKQLELIKKVLEKSLLQLSRSSLGNIQFCNLGNAGDYKAEFDEALASFVINLWQDLSDNQKQEIKEILK